MVRGKRRRKDPIETPVQKTDTVDLPLEKKSDEEINLFEFFSKVKIKYVYLFLAVFLILGFYLRFYHADYPVIGYHGWKTVHYASEARNFMKEGFFKEGFFIPMRDTMNGIDEPADGAHHDTFPTISVVVAVLFRIFGDNIRVARLAGIVFSLASVLVFYFLIKKLFKKETLALTCAFLATINPLYVFFSHNVDVINPGLFLMLLGAYYYVCWLEKTERSMLLYLASFFTMFAIITKYTFIVIVLPMLFSFPYKKIVKDYKRYLVPFVIAGIIFSMFPAWFFYNEVYTKNRLFGPAMSSEYTLTNLIDFSIIWSKDFWNVMNSYIADNFTMLGMTLAIIGSIFFIFMFFKNKSNTGYKFMMGYFIVIFVFLFVMGFKLSGHNYHQFPVAPAIIFMIAYLIEVLGKNISNLVQDEKFKIVIYVLVAGIVIFAPLSQGKSLWTHSQESSGRMFNTQFPGLDVAGNYIREHSLPSERVFHSSGQSYGVLWHADRAGYKPPSDAAYFKRAEDNDNVTWAFVYQWGFTNYFQNPSVADYLRSNYRLVQAAFVQQGEQGVSPLYFLFKKGGSFNESQVNQMVQGKPMFKQQYFYTSGPYEIIYINLE